MTTKTKNRISGSKGSEKSADSTTWFSRHSPVLSFLISVAALILPLSYTIYHDRTSGKSAEERIARLASGLRLLTASVAPNLQHEMDESLKDALNEGPAALTEQLQKFKQQTGTFRELQAPLAPTQSQETAEILSEIARTHGEIPQTWAAIAEYVSYKSGAPVQSEKLPSCFSLDDHQKLSGSDYFQTYSDCVLDLSDLAHANAHAIHLTQAHPDGTVTRGTMWARIRLTRGVVVYRGGPSIPLDALICDQCKFDFRPSAQVPPAPGRRLSERLLAADLGGEVAREKENFGT